MSASYVETKKMHRNRERETHVCAQKLHCNEFYCRRKIQINSNRIYIRFRTPTHYTLSLNLVFSIEFKYIYFLFDTLPFFTLCSAVLPAAEARFADFFFFGKTKSSESSSPPYLDSRWSKKLPADASRSAVRFMICLAKSFSCDFASICFLISRASSASRAYFLWRRLRFAFGSSVNALNSGTSLAAIHSADRRKSNGFHRTDEWIANAIGLTFNYFQYSWLIFDGHEWYTVHHVVDATRTI